jgi:hypothetical protein
MAEVKRLQCDVTGSLHGVDRCRLRFDVEVTPASGSPSEARWENRLDALIDLSPAAQKRLLKFVERGMLKPKKAVTA